MSLFTTEAQTGRGLVARAIASNHFATEYTELKEYTESLFYAHNANDCAMCNCGADGSPLDVTGLQIDFFSRVSLFDTAHNLCFPLGVLK